MNLEEFKAKKKKQKKREEESRLNSIQDKFNSGKSLTLSEFASLKGKEYTYTVPEMGNVSNEKWFESGAFEDGYQLFDGLKTAASTVGDIGLGVIKGAGKLVEGVGDLATHGIGYGADLVGAEKVGDFFHEIATDETVENTIGKVQDYVGSNSVLGEKGDMLPEVLGYAAGIYLTGGVGAAGGLGTAGTTALTTGTIFGSGMGSGISEAYQGGATDGEAAVYGLSKGAIEAGTELLFGGFGKWFKTKGFSSGIADKGIEKIANLLTKNTKLRNVVTTAINAGGEGLEEVLAGRWTAEAKKMTYMSEEDFDKILEDEKLLEQFVLGALAGGIMSTPSLVQANKQGVDLETGLTSNEQKVVDAEVQNRISEQEKTGDKKLTSKDKAAIKEQVMTDIKRGGISIDTIESVLGGETYNNYKTITDKETSLNEQIKTLNNEISDLRKAPKTIEVEERYTEAKQELKALENELKEFNQTSNKAEIQAQLHQEVDNLTQNDRFIRESYNEKARVYQSLDIDLSKYDAKRQEAIKTLTEDVKLNNTKKTHEAVELLSKVAVDRNLKVKLVDKAFMQKQGEIEGVVKNAYITKDGEMFINIESPKYAETLAVHEVLHDMKNKTPEIYTELENAIIDFAKTKGIYDSRLKSIKETYFKLKGQEISEELAREEVAASLSEDYIATDEEFVRNLSVKQPNVFKRIYEELKYLWKIATAGSKEKRQLEKAKKLYDKVYRESANVNTTESVKNNTSEVIESIETSTEEDIAPIKEKASSEDGVFFDAQKGNTNFSLSEDMSIEEKINSSMTMKEAKDMLQRAYNSGDIRGYRNADEWLNEMGAEDVAMTLESDYPLYKKYIESNEDILNEEYSIQDVLEAYLNGTLTGKAKESAIRLDTSKDTGFIDDRFYAPQDIKGGQDLYNIANQRVTNTNRAEVYKARADFIINAHNKGYIESLGLTREEVNKKLKTWANYTQKAMNLSNSLNEGVATQNRWTGIENSTILNTISVSDKEMGNLVKSIEGHSNEWQRQYITSTMLALDTHINYKDLSFEFDDKGMSSNTALGEYNDRERKIRIRVAGQNTVAHEMGHYIDHSWGRDLGYTGSDGLTGRGVNLNKLNPEQKQFVKNFYNFLNDIENSSDIGSSYKMASNEVFARFVARFTEWTKNQATNNRYGYEAKWYQDNFNERQYREFVKILQEKAMLDTTIPSSKAETRYSLSEEVSNIAPTRSWGVRVKDMKLEEAPVREEPTESVKTVQETDYAPLTAFDAFIRDTEQENPDFENYIPDEVEAPYYEPEGIKVDDPFYERDIKDVGDRKVKAYMYENPEVKPFFQQEAQAMLYELENSIKGEKQYNDHLYAESGGEKGWFGTKRTTSDDIAYLLDNFKYTYADIKKGLNAIIEDNGKENNAISKRIEFALNDRLKDGYTDFLSGYEVPANQDYINLLAEKQINTYSDEAYNEWVKSLADLPSQDIAPVRADMDFETPNGIQQVLDAETGDIVDEEQKVKRKTHGEVQRAYVENIKNTFAESGFDFDKVLEQAKDKSTFASVDNTPQRYIEKTLGYKEGQILNDLTINKEALNESEGIKWLNSFTHRKNGELAKLSKKYGIKPNSKEDAAAQMYAEGFYVNDNNEVVRYKDAELAMDFPDVNVQNRIKGLANDPRIRQIYDDTLEQINESRTRNGFEAIPRRENYFLHFRAMDDTFSKLGIPFNPNDIRAKDLPTDINGMTADLKPNQPYFASANQRKGLKTSHSLIGGMERYLTSAKNQIYHIEDIQTLRGLRNYIADMYGQAHGLENLDTLTEEEAEARIKEVYDAHLSTFAKFLNEQANVLAGKTSLIDRGLEGIIGRRGVATFNTINSQVAKNMVGFNVSSSLTNFVGAVQGFAKVNKFDAVKAFSQVVSNKINSIFGKSDGFVENDAALVRRKGAEKFYRTPVEKISDVGYSLMSGVDNITSEFLVRAKYNELTRKGMSDEQAHIEAGKWAMRILGDRSLGQQPQLYNSKMLGLITKFQLEVRNQLDAIFYDTVQDANVSTEDIANATERNAKKAVKITSTMVQLAVLQHLFGVAFESVAGYNPAFDIIGVMMKLLGMDDDEDSEDTVLDNTEQAFLELLGDLPYTSTFTGGRIPIESALPVEQFVTGKDDYGNEKSRWETLKEAAPYWLNPVGGTNQIKKSIQGLMMFDDDLPVKGSYTDSGNLRFPIEDTLGNRVQAGVFGQWANENARDYFNNERKPLKEKQIEEFADLDIPIKDYWEYREGLSEQETLEDKFDYIAGLDLPVAKKNIMINNVVDRKEEVDLINYDDFSSLEEFDFATKYPEKYNFFQSINVSYEDYSVSEDTKRAYNWAYENPEKYLVSKAIGDVVTYRQYASELYDIKADKDKDGKTVNGSRKTKVVAYINNLDIDYGAKLLLLKSEYPSEDRYNSDIVEYLNSRSDITYEQMKTILEELGFTVNGNNVSW